MQTLPALLLLLSFATAANAADPSAPQGSDAAPRVTLAFHSAFLMNLHHFLYDMAVHKEKLTGLAWHAKPDQKEMAALQNAIAFYRARYADKSLLHDPAMSAIKRALTLDDAIRSASGRGLPAELTATLNRAAPVYARCLWPAHDR
ncbi:MAG: hypothetical protein WB767_04955, partial [Nocardioides sp.]